MPTVHSHQTYKKIKGTTMVFCIGTMVIQFLNTMIYEYGTHLVPPYYSLMSLFEGKYSDIVDLEHSVKNVISIVKHFFALHEHAGVLPYHTNRSSQGQ